MSDSNTPSIQTLQAPLRVSKPQTFSVILAVSQNATSSTVLVNLLNQQIGVNKLAAAAQSAAVVRIIDAEIEFSVNANANQNGDAEVTWAMFRDNHPQAPFPSGLDCLTQYNSGRHILALAGQPAFAVPKKKLEFLTDGISDCVAGNQAMGYGVPTFHIFYNSSLGAQPLAQNPGFCATVRGHFVTEGLY